jgi:hypothetical protein
VAFRKKDRVFVHAKYTEEDERELLGPPYDSQYFRLAIVEVLFTRPQDANEVRRENPGDFEAIGI